MPMTFKIHPAIGIARVGDSPDQFYLAPEGAGELPIECNASGLTTPDAQGVEPPITTFKDPQGRVKRQAARFRVFAYDEANPQGLELKVSDTITFVQQRTGQLITAKLLDVNWTVYIANKKASWYRFQELDGEHGYPASHPLRNPEITDNETRRRLIIDPGPQSASYLVEKRRKAKFAAGANPQSPQSFPPPLSPCSIDYLGELMATQQDGHNRLLVLGGRGNSGSVRTGLGEPSIQNYANNDGWFDDVSDGPVTASLLCQILKVDGRDPLPTQAGQTSVAVDDPAWVIVGYPRFAPQILDMVTLNEVVEDLAVRQFDFRPEMYGVPPFDPATPPPQTDGAWRVWREQARWNTDYYPHFYRDIWPILSRPQQFSWVMDFDPFTGGDPHNDTPGQQGNLDPDLLSIPPYHGQDPAEEQRFRARRKFVFEVLRRPGEENQLTRPLSPGQSYSAHNSAYRRKESTHSARLTGDLQNRLIAMPYLCGDNPLSNSVVSKFLRLTDTMLFLLGQWALGKFINEKREDIPIDTDGAAAKTGRQLDQGVLSNALGGAFCPGGEVSWIIRNPAIYARPYRINVSTSYTAGSLSTPGDVAAGSAGFTVGMEPGDLTRYSGVPWQSDFNECSDQPIDITYEKWNVIEPGTTGDPIVPVTQLTYWWPSHRPMEVNTASGAQVLWSAGIPQTSSGDLEMVTAWKKLGFILGQTDGSYVLVESNWHNS
jgi:L-Lysine epsilon oxidase N-terminal/L-lysine epsilon oxidase C-terminal domain